jgi:hypothetical protein
MTEESLLNGVNVLLEGPAGTGKTHAVGTLVESDPQLEVFYLATENGLETLLGYWTDRGLPVPANLHWTTLFGTAAPASSGSAFSMLAEAANLVNTMALDSLHKMQDVNRMKHNHFVTLLRILADFPDARTGQKFGAVDSWGPNRALVVDSLSGINPIAMSLVIGGKPVRSQGEWGIAQDQIEKLLRQLCDGSKCHFVLISHVEREVDQVFGGVKVTVATLGKALAPKIPPMFSDVILSVREGSKFTWSTANSLADLKARNLPIADGIKPDFKIILDKWKSRGGRFSPTVKKG